MLTREAREGFALRKNVYRLGGRNMLGTYQDKKTCLAYIISSGGKKKKNCEILFGI